MVVPDYRNATYDTSLSSESLAGPLAQLRLSTLPHDPVSLPKRSRPVRPQKHKKAQEIRRIKKPLQDAGFLLESQGPLIAMPDTNEDDVIFRDRHEQDSLQLASLFLDSAKTLSTKYNIIDPLQNKNGANGSLAVGGKQVQVSKVAKQRAEIVRSAIELKYHWIQKSVEKPESGEHIHPNIDGCYNPLQVLRNRAVRMRLHHPTPPVWNRSAPCNAFSSHSVPGGKQWRMLWYIDLNELVADMAWRKFYWNELRDPKGELWFAKANPPPVSKKNRLSRRLHDRLWNDSDSEKTDLENYLLQIPIQSRSKDAKSLKSNLREKARRIYGHSSSSNIDFDALQLSHEPTRSTTDNVSQLRISRISKQPVSTGDYEDPRFQFEFPSENGIASSESPGTSAVDLQAPLIVVGDVNIPPHSSTETPSPSKNGRVSEGLNIHDVNFNPVNLKDSVESTSPLQATPTHKFELEETQVNQDESIQDNPLDIITRKSIFLLTVLTTNISFMETTNPSLLQMASHHLDSHLSPKLSSMLAKITEINNELLPSQELLYKGFIDEAKGLMHMANDDCAIKIDNLLSSTDRAYSELNTSLLMELRKTNEVLNKLSYLFFGSATSFEGDEKLPLNIDGVVNHPYLYFALENLIVVLLRVIWIFVSVGRVFYLLLRLIWKTVAFFTGF